MYHKRVTRDRDSKIGSRDGKKMRRKVQAKAMEEQSGAHGQRLRRFPFFSPVKEDEEERQRGLERAAKER